MTLKRHTDFKRSTNSLEMATDRFCFLAIVRDESKVIERCLESVKNIATSYLICDTGSQDDTVDKIQAFMTNCGIPGDTIRREWLSYGENKSELCKVFRNHPYLGGAKYICWLDADEVFITDPKNPLSYPTKEDADKLYEYLESRPENVFKINTIYSTLIYSRWQFARNNQLYEWRLPYQEYFTGTISYLDHELPLPLWNFSRHEGNSSRDPQIMDKRIAMSERWMERNPDSSDLDRMTYYLADAYIGRDNARAIELFKKRLTMKGFYQERYVSMLKLAKLVDPLAEKMWYWHSAQELCPERLEAFYDKLNYFHLKDNHRQAAAVYFAAPEERTPPSGSLFVERYVYEYLFDLNASVSFFYIGEYQKAYEIGFTLFARKTCPPHQTKLVEDNLRFFREKYRPTTDSGLRDFTRTTPLPSTSSPLPCVIIIDNFYTNPVQVREKALGMEYLIKGNYPGVRTVATATEEDKLRFESIVGRKIVYWPTQPTQYNGSFQYTTKDQKSWIHRDQTDFSAVVYLTPDAPANGGTVLYRHRSTGMERTVAKSDEDAKLNNDGNDESLWEVVDRIGNKFNRVIIFQGSLSHKSDVYFGDDLQTGRLFQTFFFNVEGRKY
jgi:glycosyltransferase involved in cell wall biosynthesis